MCITSKQQMKHDILAYLVEHPDAQDTLEGIVGWWLLEQRIVSGTAEVKEVLTELVANHLVLERKGADARSHYGINPSEAGEVATLLKQPHQPEGG